MRLNFDIIKMRSGSDQKQLWGLEAAWSRVSNTERWAWPYLQPVRLPVSHSQAYEQKSGQKQQHNGRGGWTQQWQKSMRGFQDGGAHSDHACPDRNDRGGRSSVVSEEQVMWCDDRLVSSTHGLVQQATDSPHPSQAPHTHKMRVIQNVFGVSTTQVFKRKVCLFWGWGWLFLLIQTVKNCIILWNKTFRGIHYVFNQTKIQTEPCLDVFCSCFTSRLFWV